jgi:RHS repeat-associated protein
MSIHSHLPFDQSTSHARIPAGGINLIASIDSVSEAQFTASFFGSTKALHGENATTIPATTTHNHRNQQYSITAVTTSAGAIAERYAYSAYGEPTICDASGSTLSSSAINNRYSYTGREWDATVGLYHFRARWMSPKTGRFMGRDPIGFKGSEWDLYEFLAAQPVSNQDPDGLLYGNWCGPFTAGPRAPIDWLDGACQSHDRCLATWKQFFPPCNVVRCDHILCFKAQIATCLDAPVLSECLAAKAIIIIVMCNPMLGTVPGMGW